VRGKVPAPLITRLEREIKALEKSTKYSKPTDGELRRLAALRIALQAAKDDHAHCL
jgi:hypothetical protein